MDDPPPETGLPADEAADPETTYGDVEPIPLTADETARILASVESELARSSADPPPPAGPEAEAREIRVAIVGVGSCASAVLQGIEHYRHADQKTAGLLHHRIGPYGLGDIKPVAAFDIDPRKVGRPLHEAAFARPNCARVFHADLPDYDVTVQMAPVLDGVAAHMQDHPAERAYRVADATPIDMTRVLREARAEVLIVYLPVGSERAIGALAQASLDAGVALVNCAPALIASNDDWAVRFQGRRIPLVGDDIKSQIGATIVHRVLARLLGDRGVRLDRTSRHDTGGSPDVLSMLDRSRLQTRHGIDLESVRSQVDHPLEAGCLHIAPPDYVPWQGDNKICLIRMEWRGFGDVPMHLEMKLSVEDAPNNAAMAIDAVRCAKLALDRGLGGPLLAISSFTMKHPPRQLRDSESRVLLERWIQGDCEATEQAVVSVEEREPILA